MGPGGSILCLQLKPETRYITKHAVENMKEKASLIIYFFKIPFSFPLIQSNGKSENPIRIYDVEIESHIDYISEYGNIVSKNSRSGTKLTNVWISGTTHKTNRAYFYNILEHPLGGKQLDIGDILSSRIQPLAHNEGLNPLEFRLTRETRFPQLELLESGNPKITDQIDSIGPDSEVPPETMYFDASKMTFNLIKLFTRVGSSTKIVMSYSELENTPFLVLLFLHLPIILTSIVVVILVLSFDTGISKDVIQNEISRLPMQKYTTGLEFCECPICLDSFQINEDVRILCCKHCFHKDCIDSWLTSMLRCPICRKSVTKLADSENYAFYQSLNATP